MDAELKAYLAAMDQRLTDRMRKMETGLRDGLIVILHEVDLKLDRIAELILRGRPTNGGSGFESEPQSGVGSQSLGYPRQ